MSQDEKSRRVDLAASLLSRVLTVDKKPLDMGVLAGRAYNMGKEYAYELSIGQARAHMRIVNDGRTYK